MPSWRAGFAPMTTSAQADFIDAASDLITARDTDRPGSGDVRHPDITPNDSPSTNGAP